MRVHQRELPRKTKRRWLDNIKVDNRDIRLGSVDWTCLPLLTDQWRDLVNTGSSLIAAQCSAFREGLSSMEIVIVSGHEKRKLM
jgi:ATP phosphoribosyltransferase